MNFVPWDRLQWLPPLWGVVGAITFLWIPFSHELSFWVSSGFVCIGGGLLYFIVRVPLTYGLEFSPRVDSERALPLPE